MTCGDVFLSAFVYGIHNALYVWKKCENVGEILNYESGIEHIFHHLFNRVVVAVVVEYVYGPLYAVEGFAAGAGEELIKAPECSRHNYKALSYLLYFLFPLREVGYIYHLVKPFSLYFEPLLLGVERALEAFWEYSYYLACILLSTVCQGLHASHVASTIDYCVAASCKKGAQFVGVFSKRWLVAGCCAKIYSYFHFFLELEETVELGVNSVSDFLEILRNVLKVKIVGVYCENGSLIT